MKKLSILVVISLVASSLAAIYEYDFNVILSDNYFEPLNATVTLYAKVENNPGKYFFNYIIKFY